MSLHHFYLNIPASTSYMEDTVSVEAGIINEVEVYWPLNVKRLCGVYFAIGESHVIPASGYLTGNGNLQHFTLNEEINDSRLSMRGVNIDSEFSHEIDAWVNILPMRGTVEGILSAF